MSGPSFDPAEGPADILAELAARAERAGNRVHISIVVEDEADGAKYEALALGTPELIRAIAALPLV